jgi:hypothetical protein
MVPHSPFYEARIEFEDLIAQLLSPAASAHLQEAEAAVTQAKAVHDRLTAERATADLTLLQRQQQVRDLERRMVEWT